VYAAKAVAIDALPPLKLTAGRSDAQDFALFVSGLDLLMTVFVLLLAQYLPDRAVALAPNFPSFDKKSSRRRRNKTGTLCFSPLPLR